MDVIDKGDPAQPIAASTDCCAWRLYEEAVDNQFIHSVVTEKEATAQRVKFADAVLARLSEYRDTQVN